MKKGYGKNYTRGSIRRKIIEENLIPYVCEICGINKWIGKDLTLRLDHKNGNNGEHTLKNLRFLCPNCDSQQDTYCYRNVKKKPGA